MRTKKFNGEEIVMSAQEEAEFEAQEIEGLAPVVPYDVSAYQAKAAIFNNNLTSAVEAYFEGAGAGTLAEIAWINASRFRRASPFVEAIAPALGLTAQDLDNLFIEASQIE